MASSTYREWILETIDQLRKRKARPDLERICHMLDRKHGLSFQETTVALAKLVDEEIVIKVDYKGSTSYRNAAKWKKSNIGGHILNSSDLSLKIQRLIGAVNGAVFEENEERTEADGAFPKSANCTAPVSSGASVADIIRKWQEESETCTLTLHKAQIQRVLDKEVEQGILEKLLDGTYAVIPDQKRIPREKDTGSSSLPSSPSSSGSGAPPTPGAPPPPLPPPLPPQLTPLEVLPTTPSASQPLAQPLYICTPPSIEVVPSVSPGPPTSSSGSNYSSQEKWESLNKGERSGERQKSLHSPGKRGRPAGSGTKRKKIKKSLCPEFEYHPLVKKHQKHVKDEPQEPGSAHVGPPPILPLNEGGDPKCDFCLMTAACNRRGHAEPLLVCKDCHAKAHPSCMDYSEALAKRARNSPWQCIDCKTCCICEDSNDPDAMLFCDACDKGYHTSCHDPPVSEQPTGKWVCSKCVYELDIKDSEEGMDTTEVEIKKENISITDTESAPACLPTPSASPVQFSTDTEKKPIVKMNGSMAAPIPKLATTMKAEVPDASYWTIDDVVSYFMSMGFIDQAEVFREQEIDGRSLLLMKRNDVLTGLSLKLGPALKIYAHVQRLQTRGQIVF